MNSTVENAAKDLLEAGAVLVSDAAFVRDKLDHEPSQFWRRQYVRACFAFIECSVYNFKKIIFTLHENDVLRIELGELSVLREEAWTVNNHGG